MNDNHQSHMQPVEPFVFGQAVKVNGVAGFRYRGRFGDDSALIDNERIFPPLIVPLADIVADDNAAQN